MAKKLKTTNEQRAEERILKARSAIIMDSMFFGPLLVRFESVPTEGSGTMGTDGTNIFYDPVFVNELSDQHLKGVLVHEVMHVVLTHHARMQEREPRKWNMACDHAINRIIKESGFTLPEPHLDDDAFEGMSAEEIYARLPDENGNGSGGEDKWNFGGVMPGNAKTKDEIENEVTKWRSAVAEAAMAARMMGKLPQSLDRFIDDFLGSKLPWQEILARFVHTVTKNDFNWARPNRPLLANYRLYMPSLHSETCGSIALAIDTSGSIGQKELAEFGAELNGILDQVRPEKVTVIYCDARVNQVEEFTPDQYPVALRAIGGGGTDFKPVFDYVAEHVDNPQCLIYLTDMEGSFPSKEPEWPTLWVSNSKIDTAPFGQVVRLT